MGFLGERAGHENSTEKKNQIPPIVREEGYGKVPVPGLRRANGVFCLLRFLPAGCDVGMGVRIRLSFSVSFPLLFSLYLSHALDMAHRPPALVYRIIHVTRQRSRERHATAEGTNRGKESKTLACATVGRPFGEREYSTGLCLRYMSLYDCLVFRTARSCSSRSWSRTELAALPLFLEIF